MDEPTFPVVLREAMRQNRLSGSELARRVYGSTTDAHGRPVPRNQSEISKYMNGRKHPKISTIKRLAEALDVPVFRLTQAPAPEERGAIKINSDDLRLMAVPEAGKLRLQVNRVIDQKTALEIFGLLSA